MEKIKVMSVFGTRPEAIKMAPLVKALEACDAIESRVCLTGQHREMLDSVMQIFHLHGDFDLDIMEQRQTLSTITCKTLLGMERVFEQDKPDLILVHGDTSTTFAGALAAMRYVVYGDPKRLFSFRLEGEGMACMAQACEAFLLTQLERGFRTLEFYKELAASTGLT